MGDDVVEFPRAAPSVFTEDEPALPIHLSAQGAPFALRA